MYEYTYMKQDGSNEVTLIVDTDTTTDLVSLMAGKVSHIIPLHSKNVSAVLVSNSVVGGKALLAKDALKYEKTLVDDISYYRAVAEAQIYTNGNGIVSPKEGYGALLEEIKWNNEPLRQVAQYQYARRPAFEAGKWMDPHGHILTEEEYLNGITSRVAKKHHLEPSVDGFNYYKQVDDFYGVVAKNPDVVLFGTTYPAGTPFAISYLVPPVVGGEHKYGIYATIPEVSAKDRKSLETTVHHFLVTRVIPKMGKSIQKETPSRMGYKSRHVKQDNGSYKNILVTCDERTKDGSICGGYFKPDNQGNYVCNNCGIVYEMTEEEIATELKMALREASSDYTPEREYSEEDEDEEVVESESDEDEDEEEKEKVSRNANRLGSAALTGDMSQVEARLSKNLAAWKNSLKTKPQSEVDAKERMHEKRERHEECKKLNREAKSTKHSKDQKELYKGKWKRLQGVYILRSILAHIDKEVGTDTTELVKLVPGCKDTFYSYLKELIENNRVVSTKVGRRNTITLVPTTRVARVANPAKYDGRKYGVLEPKRGMNFRCNELFGEPKVASWKSPVSEHELCAKCKPNPEEMPINNSKASKEYFIRNITADQYFEWQKNKEVAYLDSEEE